MAAATAAAAAMPTAVIPGHSLGPLALGASLHEILSIVKADKDRYPAIDLHYSPTEPVSAVVVVTLAGNGLRLRFDGADQRLRLIEVMDFSKIKLAYKGGELLRTREDSRAVAGPAFKRIYSLFGPAYPGEYLPPRDRSPTGTYVLSWPGAAFTFPLQHSAWSEEKDHVSLLGSHVASPATHMALFDGKSWPEARQDLFVKPPSGARLSTSAGRSKDSLPADFELAHVLENGRINLLRTASAARPFTIILNETTPQDLATELGPPDATHKRELNLLAEPDPHRRARSMSHGANGRTFSTSQPSSYSSTNTDTFDTDFDSGDADDDPAERASRESFWCYFSHGLDVLVGPPSTTTNRTPNRDPVPTTPLAASPHLVVTKVIIHGNIPGSYAFNRHRRLGWTIDLPHPNSPLTSQQHFDRDMKPALLSAFAHVRPAFEMGQGKVVNRTWGGSGGASDSSFLLPDAEEEVLVEAGGGSEQWLGNTKLFAFPGLVFEVLENGAVSGLTVF